MNYEMRRGEGNLPTVHSYPESLALRAIRRAQSIRPGDMAVLATGSPWTKSIPLTVRRAA